MADVITRLGTDNTELEKGLQAAQRRVTGWSATVTNLVTGIGQGIGQSISRIPGAAISSAIGNFSRLTEEFDRIGKLSTTLQETPETIQRLGIAAQTSGTDLESLARATIRFQRSLGDIGNNPAAARALDTLGLSIDSLRNANADQLLAQLAEGFSNVGDRNEGLAALNALLGRSFQDLLPLLQQGKDAVAALNQDIAVLSEADVRSIEKFNDDLAVLKTNLEVTFVREIAVPFIEALTGGIENAEGAVESLTPAISLLGDVLSGTADLALKAANALAAFRDLGLDQDLAAELRAATAGIELPEFDTERLAGARQRIEDEFEAQVAAAQAAADEFTRIQEEAATGVDRQLPRVLETAIKLQGVEEQTAFFQERLEAAIAAAQEAAGDGIDLPDGSALAALAQTLRDSGNNTAAATVAQAAQEALAAEAELARIRQTSDAAAERSAAEQLRLAQERTAAAEREAQIRTRQDAAAGVIQQEVEILRLRAAGREEEAQLLDDKLRIEQETARLQEIAGLGQEEAKKLAQERLQLERQIADRAGLDQSDGPSDGRIRGVTRAQAEAVLEAQRNQFAGLAGLPRLGAVGDRPERIAPAARRQAEVAAAQAAVALDPLERLGADQINLLQDINNNLDRLVVV